MKTLKTIGKLISASQGLTSPPALSTECKRLSEIYILPANLVMGRSKLETYNASSFSEIKNMEAQGLLLKLPENQDVQKEALKCTSSEARRIEQIRYYIKDFCC